MDIYTKNMKMQVRRRLNVAKKTSIPKDILCSIKVKSSVNHMNKGKGYVEGKGYVDGYTINVEALISELKTQRLALQNMRRAKAKREAKKRLIAAGLLDRD